MYPPVPRTSENSVKKPSEKSQRCSKNGPMGHRSARFGPSVATKFTPKHYSNTFSDGFSAKFAEFTSELKKSLSARSALSKRPATRPKRHRGNVFNPRTRVRSEREGVFQHAEDFCTLRLLAILGCSRPEIATWHTKIVYLGDAPMDAKHRA
jgi:hypothetical protein